MNPLAPPLKHLSVVTHRHGIAGGFSTRAPAVLKQVPDWLRKLRSKISSAESGIQWTTVFQGNGVFAPLHVDQIVPYTVVFDVANASECTIDVPGPAGQPEVNLYVPEDVCKKLAKGVYSTILALIDYEQRQYYDGIRPDHGWSLLHHLRQLQHGEGTHISFLEAERMAITCEELKDFPLFKTTTSQLRLDWQNAVLQGNINRDDVWSNRQIREFLATTLATVFDGHMDRWNSDPANNDKTFVDAMAYATSLYTAEFRILDRKRKASAGGSSSFVAGAHDLAEYGRNEHRDKYSAYSTAPREFSSSSRGRGRGRGRGGGSRARPPPRRGYRDDVRNTYPPQAPPARQYHQQQRHPQQQQQRPQQSRTPSHSFYVEVEEDGTEHFYPDDPLDEEQEQDSSFLARVDEQAAAGCLEGIATEDTFGQTRQ
jgi:hypothetical protein